MEEVHGYLTSVKVKMLQCKSTWLQVKVVHSKFDLSKSTKVSESKYILSVLISIK